jgi:hypothetical protein
MAIIALWHVRFCDSLSRESECASVLARPNHRYSNSVGWLSIEAISGPYPGILWGKATIWRKRKSSQLILKIKENSCWGKVRTQNPPISNQFFLDFLLYLNVAKIRRKKAKVKILVDIIHFSFLHGLVSWKFLWLKFFDFSGVWPQVLLSRLCLDPIINNGQFEKMLGKKIYLKDHTLLILRKKYMKLFIDK